MHPFINLWNPASLGLDTSKMKIPNNDVYNYYNTIVLESDFIISIQKTFMVNCLFFFLFFFFFFFKDREFCHKKHVFGQT